MPTDPSCDSAAPKDASLGFTAGEAGSAPFMIPSQGPPTPRSDGRVHDRTVANAASLPALSALASGELPVPVPPRVPLPEQIDDFRLGGLLGEGGMGMVYAAEDVRLGRRVALKVMRPELCHHEAARQRFLREARAAAAVDHEAVIPVTRVGEQALPDGRTLLYLVMPLLTGESLEARLKASAERPLGHAEQVEIARRVAEGLAAAHAKGLIHRDIKPANVWLEPREGGGTRVRVLDFGLVHALDGCEITETGVVLGTPYYMSPEQVMGEPVDGRADLFALGCVMYRMASGRLPFTAETRLAVLGQVLHTEPPSVRTYAPETPDWYARLIERLMSKPRDGRPASAADLAAELAAPTGGAAPLPSGRTDADIPAPRPNDLSGGAHERDPAGEEEMLRRIRRASRRAYLAGMLALGAALATGTLAWRATFTAPDYLDREAAALVLPEDAPREVVGVFPAPAGSAAATRIRLTRDGTEAILAVGSGLDVQSLAEPFVRRTRVSPDPGPATVAFTPDRAFAVALTESGLLVVRDLLTGERTCQIQAEGARRAGPLAARDEGAIVLVPAEAGGALEFEPPRSARKPRTHKEFHNADVLALSPNGREIAVANREAGGDFVYKSYGIVNWRVSQRTSKVTSACAAREARFSADGNRLFVRSVPEPDAGRPARIEAWPIDEADRLLDFEIPADAAAPWCVRDDGEAVARSDGRGVAVHAAPDWANPRRIALPAAWAAPIDLDFARDGRHLAVLLADGTVVVLRL